MDFLTPNPQALRAIANAMSEAQTYSRPPG